MKKTKCLFDGRSHKGLVSVSQLQTFMSCPKKWEYGYIENLTPRIERPYLNIGRLCHKGMQECMTYKWGDTVVRHLNSKGTDGTNERLVKYEGGRNEI